MDLLLLQDGFDLAANQISGDRFFGESFRNHHTEALAKKQGRGFFKPWPCVWLVLILPLVQDKVRGFDLSAIGHGLLKDRPLLNGLHGRNGSQ